MLWNSFILAILSLITVEAADGYMKSYDNRNSPLHSIPRPLPRPTIIRPVNVIKNSSAYSNDEIVADKGNESHMSYQPMPPRSRLLLNRRHEENKYMTPEPNWSQSPGLQEVRQESYGSQHSYKASSSDKPIPPRVLLARPPPQQLIKSDNEELSLDQNKETAHISETPELQYTIEPTERSVEPITSIILEDTEIFKLTELPPRNSMLSTSTPETYRISSTILESLTTKSLPQASEIDSISSINAFQPDSSTQPNRGDPEKQDDKNSKIDLVSENVISSTNSPKIAPVEITSEPLKESTLSPVNKNSGNKWPPRRLWALPRPVSKPIAISSQAPSGLSEPVIISQTVSPASIATNKVTEYQPTIEPKPILIEVSTLSLEANSATEQNKIEPESNLSDSTVENRPVTHELLNGAYPATTTRPYPTLGVTADRIVSGPRSYIVNHPKQHGNNVLPKPVRPLQKPLAKPIITKSPALIGPKSIPDLVSSTDMSTSFLIDYECRDENGFYGVANDCDNYVECKKRMAFISSCPDGLQFNPKAIWPQYPCAYPWEVNCEVDSYTRKPQPTNECPRQYGLFPMTGNDCTRYIMCQEGRATVMSCPPGLAFNVAENICDWPERVPSCSPDVFQGFTCPPVAEDDFDMIFKYSHRGSCKEYVACKRGHPRLLKCDRGLAFDEQSQVCVDADYVQNCN